ncbi:MAG: amino-acid N-acetyltransferase [Gammaproteobacteria bacterium]|nr:amino-acid N-acetyltransferase [Gammaproteobacteria bacterium]
MSNSKPLKSDSFVQWFRSSSPYIHAHRGKTVVIAFGGEAIIDSGFPGLVHDIALLHGLGIKVVLAHGARPQIEERLRLKNAQMQVVNGLRITDETALACVKEAAGITRVEIEALFSMGLSNSPMAGANIRVASGNFVTARPLGVRDGIDYGHTGVVRRIDVGALERVLESGSIALIPPLGYSPTGEVFNLSAADVAGSVAAAIGADKLILLLEDLPSIGRKRRLPANLIPAELDEILRRQKRLPDELRQSLTGAVESSRRGVERIHLLDRKLDGAVLHELFTRDGVGIMVTTEHYEEIRTALIDDVGGILELISPLEDQGVLVRRSRELLETEIERFSVIELDGAVIGCAALYSYQDEAMGELACLAIHTSYRSGERGDLLLRHVEQRAQAAGVKRLFVLTTQTTHWFRERGFVAMPVAELPVSKRKLYNLQRNSKVLVKALD